MLGKRIADLRRKRGLKQSALAKKLGLSASAVGMYEQGRREPSIPIIVALAEELGVTIDYLLTGQTFSSQPGPPREDGNHTPPEAMLLPAVWSICSR